MIESFSYSLFSIRSLFLDFRLLENGKLRFISTSSDEVKANTLFIPLRGNRDGHEFIPDALSRNAAAFLCEENHPILKKLTHSESEKAIIVKDTLIALGVLAAFHRNRFNPIIIGITGSSGKTTTKELLGLVAKQIGTEQVVITYKNYNNEIGVPFTLFKINEKTKIVICEMGMNHKGEISRLTAIVRPSIGIITNVGPCHIENLGSVQNIAFAKAEIIEGIQKGGYLFIPETVLHKEVFIKKAREKKIIIKTFSLEKNPDVKIAKTNAKGFELQLFDKKINWKIPGEKILENLSAVVSVGKELKLSPAKIQTGISLFKAKDKRFVIEKGSFKVINDTYNANPDSMKSSLFALKQVAGNNYYYAILGDMKELGKFSKDYHLKLGEFCRTLGLCGLITFGKDSKNILVGFLRENNRSEAVHFTDSDESISGIISYLKFAVPIGSHILVKGSRSMKMERIAEGLRF